MRARFIAAVVLIVMSIGTTAHAENGWTWTGRTFVPYHFTFKAPHTENPRLINSAYRHQRELALKKARHAHVTWAQLLKKARAILSQYQSYSKSGNGSAAYWYAVLNCEEGPGTAGWATHSSSFVGGLGFRISTWRSYAPRAGVSASIPAGPFPYSPAQQIAVANAVVAGNGGYYKPWPAADCSNWSGW